MSQPFFKKNEKNLLLFFLVSFASAPHDKNAGQLRRAMQGCVFLLVKSSTRTWQFRPSVVWKKSSLSLSLFYCMHARKRRSPEERSVHSLFPHLPVLFSFLPFLQALFLLSRAAPFLCVSSFFCFIYFFSNRSSLVLSCWPFLASSVQGNETERRAKASLFSVADIRAPLFSEFFVVVLVFPLVFCGILLFPCPPLTSSSAQTSPREASGKVPAELRRSQPEEASSRRRRRERARGGCLSLHEKKRREKERAHLTFFFSSYFSIEAWISLSLAIDHSRAFCPHFLPILFFFSSVLLFYAPLPLCFSLYRYPPHPASVEVRATCIRAYL